jgi:hypothetical protein
MASGGCRKFAFYAGIGCLAVPIGLAIIIGLFLYGAQRFGQSGPQHPVPSAISVPMAAAPPPRPPAPSPGGSPASGPAVAGKDLPEIGSPASGAKPVHLTLSLSEGDFTIVPGPPGTDIKVDGLFDPKSYELTQTTEEGGDGREIRIGFRRKTPFFFLLFGNQHPENKLTITLPEGVPTALDLQLNKCESHVELGGLTLTDLQARLVMGDQNVNFERPVVGRLEHASMSLSMGDIKVRGLGNAHPADLQLQGSMGDIRVSFDGDWPEGGKISAHARMSMGDFRVTIPRGVRVKSSSSMVLGDSRRMGRGKVDATEDPNAPLLEL